VQFREQLVLQLFRINLIVFLILLLQARISSRMTDIFTEGLSTKVHEYQKGVPKFTHFLLIFLRKSLKADILGEGVDIGSHRHIRRLHLRLLNNDLDPDVLMDGQLGQQSCHT